MVFLRNLLFFPAAFLVLIFSTNSYAKFNSKFDVFEYLNKDKNYAVTKMRKECMKECNIKANHIYSACSLRAINNYRITQVQKSAAIQKCRQKKNKIVSPCHESCKKRSESFLIDK